MHQGVSRKGSGRDGIPDLCKWQNGRRHAGIVTFFPNARGSQLVPGCSLLFFLFLSNKNLKLRILLQNDPLLLCWLLKPSFVTDSGIRSFMYTCSCTVAENTIKWYSLSVSVHHMSWPLWCLASSSVNVHHVCVRSLTDTLQKELVLPLQWTNRTL